VPEFNLSDYMKMKKDYDDQSALWGLTTNKGLSDMSQVMPYFGTGYEIGSSLFGDKKEDRKLNRNIMKENLGMLKEQRAANQEMLGNKRKFNENWANASNGLAARATEGTIV